MALPEPPTLPLAKVKLTTPVPSMPQPPVDWMLTLVSETPLVLVNAMPWPVEFWITPPESSPPTVLVPSPVIVKPPVEPVVFSTMPFVPPLVDTFLNVTPLAAIVVLEILIAVVVNGVVAPIVFVPVTASVPLVVAAKAVFAPVLDVMPPLKVNPVVPLLLSRMPVPLSVIAPLNATVPLVRLWMSIERPLVLLMVPA